MVDHYRVGRAFVAGDAAHIHSPFGAQGMNTGIQDAFNLAWKLALVVRGETTERLLDTYEEERLPVARRVLDQTDANTRVMFSHNPVMAFVREQILTLDAVQGHLARRGSQLLVNYRASSLSREDDGGWTEVRLLPDRGHEAASVVDRLDFRAAPRAGDRAPDAPCRRASSGDATTLYEQFRGTHFTLLLFDGLAGTANGYANLSEIGRRVADLLGPTGRAHVVVARDRVPAGLDWPDSVLLDPTEEMHRRYGAAAESLYLIRPDGYVGFRGQPAAAEPLLAYLRHVFRTDLPPRHGRERTAAPIPIAVG
jgi:hypothetical protein